MTATIDAPGIPTPRRTSYPPAVVRRLPPPDADAGVVAGPTVRPAAGPAAGHAAGSVAGSAAGPIVGSATAPAEAQPPPRPPMVPGNPRSEIEAVLRLVMEMLDGRRAATAAGGRIGPMALRYLVAARTRLRPTSGRLVGTPGHGPPGLRSMRMSHPAEGVTEASAVWLHRGRARALAARFEWRAGRWRCTVLRLG